MRIAARFALAVLTLSCAAALAQSIVSVTPSSGQQGQSYTLNITGQSTTFTQGKTTANISGTGVAAGTVTVFSPTFAMVTVSIDPAAATTARDVTLTTVLLSGTENATLAGGFTVTPPPSIALVNPNTGQQGQQNLSVAITGQNTHFAQGTTTASLGAGITVNSTSVVDSTHATVNITITAGAAVGPRDVTLTTGGEVVTKTGAFTVNAGTPVVTSVNPSVGQQGQTLASVAVTGQFTNFVNNTTVANFGAGITVNSTTVSDSTHATVSITIAGNAGIGPRTVTMTTNAEVANSSSNAFSVVGAPAIATVTPNAGQQGQTIASAAVVGQFTNFVNGATAASFGAGITVNSTTVTDATHATVSITITAAAATGARTVTMTTNAEVASLTSGFTVNPGTPAVITVNPNTGQQGQALASVAVTGQFTNFVNGTTVASFGAGITVNSTTVTDATHATVNIAILGNAALGARTVTMTTNAEVASSSSNAFSVVGAPAIATVTPNSGQQGQTLASVAVVGQFTNFVNGATAASFGAGITVNSTTVTDATHATVNITITAAAATGARTVTMTTNAEVATLASGFTVNPGTPAVITVNPNTGQQGQTIASVAVTGQFTNFVNNTTTASFGAGITVNSTTVSDATHATVNITIAPGAAPGARTVTMTTNAEVASSSSNAFSVVGTPSIATVTPNAGQQGQTIASVAVVGQFTNFVNGSTVASFGAGITVNSTTVTDATHATVNITITAAAATGARTVTMTTNAEVATLASGFTVNPGTPAITIVSPNTGQQGQTLASVAVTGQFTNFVNNTTTASFGAGITVNSTTVADATHATVNITILANAAPGARTVTMTTNAEVASLAGGFTVTAGTPVILSVTPNAGQQGQTIAPVAIVGQYTNFVNGATVANFGAGITVNSTAVTDSTHATVNIAIAANAALSARTVTMTTGAEVVSLAGGFTVGSGTPVIATVTPNSGQQGQTIASVAVVGQFTNFVNGTTAATFSTAGITVNSTTVTDAAHATLNITIAGGATLGAHDVTLTTNSEVATLAGGFTVVAPAATKLAFSPQPGNGTAGQPLSPSVVVQIQDAGGNVFAGSSAAVTITSTPAGVGGTVTVNAASGIATFSNLVFNAAGSYTLTATSAGVTSVTSAQIAIVPGAPAKLVFTSQPTSGAVAQTITAPVVQVQDAQGNLVTASTALVAVNSTPSGVAGTLGVNASGGVATFANLAFSPAGNYTLTATSSGLASATTNSIMIVGTLTITTTTLNAATRLSPFSQQLTAAGGLPPYTWSVPAGSLAAGLTLTSAGQSAGLISGTPTTNGNFAFTARVRDANNTTADQSLVLTVADKLGVSACPASNGVVGQAYSSTAVATGGTSPYTWSLLVGAFPPGLALNSQSGALTGTPTASGTFTTTLQVTDKSTATATQSCGFTIAPPLSIATVTVSDASVSSPYTQTLLASGGKGPYTWALVTGSTLPQGLTLSTSGVIGGTPTQQGTFNFTIAVTDSTNVTVSQAYTMNVVAGLIVGGCPASLSEVGFAYNSALVGQGGTAPYTWSVTTGTLPTGLLLNAAAGTITGTPTVVGIVQLTFTTTDKSSRTATKQCSIEVRAALSIASVSLSQGNTGASYSDSVAVTGGVAPFVFSTTAGSLPPGISLDSGTGQLSGRPTTAGSFQFTVAVSDNVGAQATRSLTITVAAGFTIPNCPTPVATVNQAYSGSLVVQGGTPPYFWIVPPGSLPPGLVLDSSNAVITGVPTTPGTSNFLLGVADSAAPTPNNATRSCSIQVNPAPFAITSAASLPNALVGVTYTQTLTATGGVAPYTWLVASGSLPASFTLDPTGVLSGTTTAAGTFNFTVQATDQGGTTARQNITLTVLAGTAPTVTITGLSDIVDPATQPSFGIQLAGSYPALIDGTVKMTVIPDPAVGVADPAVLFANGKTTLPFRVPAGSTVPDFLGAVAVLQTGTVAATIQLSVTLTSNGSDVTPPNTAVRSIRIDRLSPRIVSMTVVRTSGGLEVHIVGFSTTRQVTQGSFQFSVSGGSPLSADVSMSAAGSAWFSSPQSQTFGGQFALVQPFTLQGSVGTITSVSATLSNAQGTSPAATTNF